MKIQITDYGVTQITESKEPLKIAKAVFGSSYGYTPSNTATGIKGSEVHSTNVDGPKVINANVVKYELGVEYEVGPFAFGEIAYFDGEDKCVAVAVADNPIAKLVQTNKSRGNSIRIDAYLSMVGTNFNMWIESIGSDIDFYVPIISSFDVLPPVNLSDPNFYIVDSPSENACTTLAYAGSNAIWEFDNYLFSNTRQYKITAFTPTTVTIDISSLDAEGRETLVSKFYGDKLIEFNSGGLYSICRTALNIAVQANTAVISFKTPLAELPKIDDTLLLFSRTDVSISDLVLPIATDAVLGAIKLGEGLVGQVDGTTSVDFPVTSVNGQLGDVQLKASDIEEIAQVAITGNYNDLLGKPESYNLPVASSTVLGGVKPQSDFSIGDDGSLSLAETYVQTVDGIAPDESGNVTLPEPEPIVGLVDPVQIPANADLNTYTKAGLFFASDGTSFTNGPNPAATQGLTLEVIPIESLTDACIQRYTCDEHIFIRCHFLDWSTWTDISTSGQTEIGIASYSQLGTVYVKQGNGIEIDTGGGLSLKPGNGITVDASGINAAVSSVNGQTGDVEVTVSENDVFEKIDLRKNIPGGIAGLTQATGEDWLSARIESRQVAIGTFLLAGEWDPATNESHDLEDIAEGVRLVSGGFMENLTTGEQYDASGYVFICSNDGNTEIDGESIWRTGDMLLGIGELGWVRLGGLPAPTQEGAILYSKNGQWVELPKGAPNSVLGIDADGNLAWVNQITTSKLIIE